MQAYQPQVDDLLARCLAENPSTRPSATEALCILNSIVEATVEQQERGWRASPDRDELRQRRVISEVGQSAPKSTPAVGEQHKVVVIRIERRHEAFTIPRQLLLQHYPDSLFTKALLRKEESYTSSLCSLGAKEITEFVGDEILPSALEKDIRYAHGEICLCGRDPTLVAALLDYMTRQTQDNWKPPLGLNPELLLAEFEYFNVPVPSKLHNGQCLLQ